MKFHRFPPYTWAAIACPALLLAIWLPHSALAVFSNQAKEAATISGTVTINGVAAADIVVLLVRSDRSRVAEALTRTDEEGFYEFAEVPPGRYSLSTSSPAYYLVGSEQYNRSSLTVTVDSGESIKNLNLRLEKGGVITGRVSDDSGRGLIGARVQLRPADGSRQATTDFRETDDRGIYRFFGVTPGRYYVSTGDRIGGVVRVGTPLGFYPLTFHPNAQTEEDARVLIVTPGVELKNIDISVGELVDSRTVSGRIIDAETESPVPGMNYGYAIVSEGGRVSASGYTSARTDAHGNFAIEGVSPGRYGAIAVPDRDSEYFSEVTEFQVSSSDLTGVEIRIHRGITVSGTMTIDGLPDGPTPDRFREFSVRAGQGNPEADDGIRIAPRFYETQVGPDGSFSIRGIPPGKLHLQVFEQRHSTRAHHISRLEVNGAPVSMPIPIERGEQNINILVVIDYGATTIRGRIVHEEGETYGVRLRVALTPIPAQDYPPAVVRIDDSGGFVFEGVRRGRYLISVTPLLGPHLSLGQIEVEVSGEEEIAVSIPVKSTTAPNE